MAKLVITSPGFKNQVIYLKLGKNRFGRSPECDFTIEHPTISATHCELTLGADGVIDYTAGDFTQSGETYDVVFDAVGKSSPSQSKRLLKEAGVFLSALGSSDKEKVEDLVFLRELIEAGEIKAVIDRRYPMQQIAEAHRYVETGHKKGNVAITVGFADRT